MTETTQDGSKSEACELSILEQRELMAARGDVDGIFRILRDSDSCMISIPDVGKLLLRAVEARVQADPALLTEAVFRHILGFTTFLTLQAQIYASKIIRLHANETQVRGTIPPSEELRELLPELMSLQKHALEIAQIYAATQRLHQLTRRTQLEAERLERAQTESRMASTTTRQRMSLVSLDNGAGASRIANCVAAN
jgi:hypothetical protein